MGSALPCLRRSRAVRPVASDPSAARPLSDVCTVSPRNRHHVWDIPGVNLHCTFCDDVLYSAPLDLAKALLEILLELGGNGATADGNGASGNGQAGYAIAARIQSAVCVGAAMSKGPGDLLPEAVYSMLQHVLDMDVSRCQRSSSGRGPLQELERAALLHSRFLLQLCFGCGRSLSNLPTKLAVRLFGAIRVSDGLSIWNIVEELRACMKRNWPQNKTTEGHRLQVACVLLQIYGLTSLLAGSSRILDTLETSEYSVSSALEDITAAAQVVTMTESHQVSSFGSFSWRKNPDIREENDDAEVSWLVNWLVLQACATLFVAKPCNPGQLLITTWSIKHAKDLATGQPAASTAVSLRAVSLLLSWRHKLETVAAAEESLAEVVKALSAASGCSTAHGSDYCNQMMTLMETPSLILHLARARCSLHDRIDGQPTTTLICVPGMSGENEKLGEVMKSADALSPEQLPLEFLGRSEEWPEDETSMMIRALKDQNRPEAIFSVHLGIVLEGEDILMATMSLAAAKVRCTSLPNCTGFYSDDWPDDPLREVDVHFKTTWRPRPSGASTGRGAAYQKERASPLFTRRQGYALDGADLLVADMTIEAAKKCCSELENCMGFTFQGHCVDGPTLIHFKSGTKLVLDTTGISTCYVFETESRSHALPADGAAFFQLMDGKASEAENLSEGASGELADPGPGSP